MFFNYNIRQTKHDQRKLSTSLGNHFEKSVLPEDYMSVICGDFNICGHTVSSFYLHYVENANCTRETKTSNSCSDVVYSNVKNDSKVSPTTLTDHYALFFEFSEQKQSFRKRKS